MSERSSAPSNKTGKRISVKSSNSPLGGGSVRVYVGDKLVWSKRVKDVSMLVRVETKIKDVIRSDEFSTESLPIAPGLRLV